MTINFKERANFIWSIAELLRGDYKQSEYGRVILPLTVLRRLDCVLEPTKEAVLSYLPQINNLLPYLAKVFHARQDGICGGELLVLRPSMLVDSRFLYYRAISNDFIRVIDGSTYGTKMPRASWDFIGNLFITYPSTTEQKNIADFLDHKTAQIDAQVTRTQKAIEYLKEYRTALISEVVTGKIDVREVGVCQK